MINIVVDEKSITVNGHAEYAEAGKDIVCAGISTLFITLVESLHELTAADVDVDIDIGRSSIKFNRKTEESDLLVKSFFVGVGMIADEYPDNVRLENRCK